MLQHDGVLIPRSAVAGNLWPAIPAPSGASMLAMQFQFEQSQWWTPGVIHDHQTRQIRLLLDHAARTVPYYGKRLGKGAAALGSVDSDEWRGIPLLRRADIQAAGKDLLSRALPPTHGRTLEYQSSGSTGQPIRSYGSEVTLFFIGALNLRDHLWHGRDLSAKVAAIRSKVTAQNHPGWGAATDVAFSTGPLAVLDIATDVEAQLQWLVQQDPRYLLTSPPNALELARLSIATGVRPANLRELRTFGETLPPDLRMTCRKAWGVPVTDIYSAEEVGAIALQCPGHEHYHVQAENLLVEILDEQGRLCRPGETGRVVITTLHNFAMPLVRYENGDYAELGEPCPCGRGLMVLKRILGRQRNMVALPDGTRHWPSFPSETWMDIAPIKQIQLVQRTLQRIDARIVCSRALTPQEENSFILALQESLGYPFDIAVHHVEAIPRTANAKYEDFISEVSPNPPAAP